MIRVLRLRSILWMVKIIENKEFWNYEHFIIVVARQDKSDLSQIDNS